MLLQNPRFREEEEKKDPQFSKELASLADISFWMGNLAAAHRFYSSTVGVGASSRRTRLSYRKRSPFPERSDR